MLAVGIPVVLVLVLVVAWSVDSAGAGGNVARNVSLAGLEVGGQSEADVRSIVADLAEAFETAEVRIDADNTQYTTTASELGVAMDQEATVAAVLEVGDDTALPLRPFDVGDLVRPDAVRAAPVRRGRHHHASDAHRLGGRQPASPRPSRRWSPGRRAWKP